MGIEMSCAECGARSYGGVLEHLKTCTAVMMSPSFGTGPNPPAINPLFNSQKEQAEWLRNLESGSSEQLAVPKASTDLDQILDEMEMCNPGDEIKARKEAKQSLEALIHKREAEIEEKAINTLAKAQLKMRPLIALKDGNGEPDGNWYVMYWDDTEQVWNKARYADIVEEVAIRELNRLDKALFPPPYKRINYNKLIDYKVERTKELRND